MAYEIRKKPVIGNFKDRVGPKIKHKNRPWTKRPGNSPEYLKLIRQLPCATCPAYAPNDPHHLKQGTAERGAGQRSTDQWAIPMCRKCHGEVERIGSRNEISWFNERGIHPLELARSLWANKHDFKSMLRVLKTHKKET